VEAVNAKTGVTHSQAREFIRNHFEESLTPDDERGTAKACWRSMAAVP
jgi:hypothetical protein